LEGTSRRHPRLRWLWAALAVGCVISFARLAVYMQDPAFAAGAVLPTRAAKHMCLPAYLRGAELARQDPAAVYETAPYATTAGTALAGLDRFMRDPYMYPPPALIPARIAIATTHDFFTIRTLWFSIQVLFFVAVSLALARSLAPSAAAAYVALWPLLAMAWP